MFHGLGKKVISNPIGDDNVAGNATRFEQIEDGGVGTAPAPDGGMQRFPTEPPPSYTAASRGSASRAWNWSGGAIGFLAGVFAMAIWRRLHD